MEQLHLRCPQSQNSPLKPAKEVWPTELNIIPNNKWENVDSARGQILLGHSKNQEFNCAGQGYWGRPLREDFVLFDEASPAQPILDDLDRGYLGDDDIVVIESIESTDRTEWSLEDTPHLRLPPQPGPTRLPTPDFDDEISLTFFPPLDTIGDMRQRCPATGKCEDTMPLPIALSNSPAL